MSIINYLKSQIPPDLDPWVFNKKDDDATSVHSDIAMEDSEGKVQYVVERVLSKRKNAQGEPEYLIKWKGHTYSELSWELWSDLIRQNPDPDLLKLESKSEEDSVRQSRFRKIAIAQKDAFGTDLIEKINRFNAQLRSSRMSKIQCFRSRKIPFTSKPHFPRFWIEGKEEGYFDKIRARSRHQWQIGCPNYEILRNFKPFKSPKRKNYIIDEDVYGMGPHDFQLVDRPRFADVTSTFTGSNAGDTTSDRYTKPEYKRETYGGHRHPQLASKRVVSRYEGDYPLNQPHSSYYATDATSDMQDAGNRSRTYGGEVATSDPERSSKVGTDNSGIDQLAQQSSSDLYPTKERSSSAAQVIESDKRKIIHYAAKMATAKPRDQQIQKEEDSQYSEQQSAQQPSDSREDEVKPTRPRKQEDLGPRRRGDPEADRYDFESNYKRRHAEQQKLRQQVSKMEEDDSEISASAYQMVKQRQVRQEVSSEEEEPTSSRRQPKKPSTIREESDSYAPGSSDTPSDAKPDLRVNLIRVGKDKRRPSAQVRQPDTDESSEPKPTAVPARERSGSRRQSRRRLASLEVSDEESTPQVKLKEQRMTQAEIRRHSRSRSGRKSMSRDLPPRRRSTSRGSRRHSGRSSHKSRSKSRGSRKSRSRSRGSRSRRRMESELRRRSRSRNSRRSRSRRDDPVPFGPRGEIGKNSMEKIITAIFDKDGQYFEVSWKKENGIKPANSLVEDQLLARVYPNELIRYITNKR